MGTDARAALLLSGGIESTTLLYALSNLRGALFVDYGQRGARQERLAASRHAVVRGVPLTILRAAAVGKQMNQIRGLQYHVPFPQRNLWLIALAINWAVASHVNRLYIGWNAEDARADASASAPCLAAWQQLSLGQVAIEAPLLHLAKAAVVAHGRSLGLDYADTYSCLRGRLRPCGRCPQCRARTAAVAIAGAEGYGIAL